MSGAAGVELRPVSTAPEALERYRELFAAAFPGAAKYSVAYLRWQYAGNPSGPPVGFDAVCGDRVVAHYACIPVPMLVRGTRCLALLSLNTATHPDFQGKGLFTTLASATYDAARRLGHPLVYGIANANSTPGFVRKLGFQRVEPLEAGFVVGRLPALGDDAGLDLAPAWDAASLRWRLDNPHGGYRETGQGWIRAETDRSFVRSYAAARPGWPAGAAPRGRAGAHLRLFLGTLHGLRWERSWLVPIPKALRPSPLNLIYRPLADDVPATIGRARVGALEFDPY